MTKTKNKDIKYKVHCYRLSDKTGKRFKKAQTKENTSWNIFINKLLDQHENTLR